MSDTEIQDLENRITSIEQRNEKVELDKAWEQSTLGTLLVLFLTYAFTACLFYMIGVENYLLNALIPTLAYYLSTLSLNFLKKVWQGKRVK